MMALPSKATCLRVMSSPPLMLAGGCVRLVPVAELAFGLHSAPSFLVGKTARIFASICCLLNVSAVHQDATCGAHGEPTSCQNLGTPLGLAMKHVGVALGFAGRLRRMCCESSGTPESPMRVKVIGTMMFI
eukprot:3379053-Heterocapsa_arctica.AAC.1